MVILLITDLNLKPKSFTTYRVTLYFSNSAVQLSRRISNETLDPSLEFYANSVHLPNDLAKYAISNVTTSYFNTFKADRSITTKIFVYGRPHM